MTGQTHLTERQFIIVVNNSAAEGEKTHHCSLLLIHCCRKETYQISNWTNIANICNDMETSTLLVALFAIQ